MTINYGLKSGALLQRNKSDTCECIFSAAFCGEARTSLGRITKTGDDLYILEGIPTGGPYTVTLGDDESEITLDDIYVGDLWLLGGQSNMEGKGKWRERYISYDADPKESLRAYYMNEAWGAAKSQLHRLWESVDACISVPYRMGRKNSLWGKEFPEIHNNGVGPGLFFASEMQRLSGGVPQGVIPCAVGGSALSQWDPDGENNFYTAAKRRFHQCGGRIKGIFWHQGETQTSKYGCEIFVDNMKHLVSSMRRDFGDDSLPFVQVQLTKYIAAAPDSDIYWSKIRELQRTLSSHIENLATVYSIDLELDDLIHLSSESQEILGRRAAEAMSLLINGYGEPSPDFDSFELVQDDYIPFLANIKVNYKNVVGKIDSVGVPSGFTILDSEEGQPLRAISRICLEGDSVRIKVEIPPEKLDSYYICYGYCNNFYCNLTDGGGRALPGFGPLKIKDHLKA